MGFPINKEIKVKQEERYASASDMLHSSCNHRFNKLQLWSPMIQNERLLLFVELLLVSKGVTHGLPEQILEGVWNTCAVVGEKASYAKPYPHYQHPATAHE